jgi:carbon-monoxide dehydrogenase medium subunit
VQKIIEVVRLKTFEYHEPRTLEEASTLLSQLGQDAMIYAGGTDIIPKIRYKRIFPAHLINIKKIPQLNEISCDKKLTIGALATFNDICFSGIVKDKFQVLAEVCEHIASHQVRNLATIGGNICNAAPSADSPPILMVYDSKVEIFDGRQTRSLLLENFFKGPGMTDLKKGEILTGIIIPEVPPNTGHAYIKHTIRKSLDIAIVGMAVSVTLDEADKCTATCIVVGASAPVPLRTKLAEKYLIGTYLGPSDVEAAGIAAANEISPIDDVRGSRNYRCEMTKINLKRAVELASGRARHE